MRTPEIFSGRILSVVLLSFLAAPVPAGAEELYGGITFEFSPRTASEGGTLLRVGPAFQVREGALKATGEITWNLSARNEQTIEIRPLVGIEQGIIDVSYQPGVAIGVTGEHPLLSPLSQDALLPRVHGYGPNAIMEKASAAAHAATAVDLVMSGREMEELNRALAQRDAELRGVRFQMAPHLTLRTLDEYEPFHSGRLLPELELRLPEATAPLPSAAAAH